MDEPNEVIEEPDVYGTVIEIDRDAETAEEAEPAETASDGEADEDPQAEADGEDPTDDDAETPTPTQEPFSFQAHGTVFEVPGAVIQELDDGEGGKERWIAMPQTAFQDSVQPHLADLSAVRRQEETFKRQIAALDPDKHPDVIAGNAVVEALDELIKLGPDEQAAWLEDAAANFKQMKLEAENKALRAARETDVDADQETKHAEFSTLVKGDVSVQVDAAAERAGITLSARIKKEVAAHMWGRFESNEDVYFTDEDGGVNVHTDRFDEAVRLFAGTREAGALKAEKENAPGKKAPRQVAVKDSPAPATKDKKYGPEDGDKWRNDMGLLN